MRRLFFVPVVLMLAACSGGEHADLQKWMVESSKDFHAGIPKLPQMKAYQAVFYEVDGTVDPFRSSKIEPEVKGRQGASKGALQPDFDARELRNSLLEKYPLESLRMIGFLNLKGRAMAVIQVEDKIKQVKVGEFIGLDFGMVTQVTDKEVKLKELIQDSAGDWSERESVLQLQGKEDGKK